MFFSFYIYVFLINLFEQQLINISKIISCIHPSMTAFGFFVFVFDAAFVEIFAVSFNVVVEKIIAANTVPKHFESFFHILFGEEA